MIEENEISQWWLNGVLHRENGPAIEYEDGTKEWYLLGIQVIEKLVIDVVQRETFLKKHQITEKQ